MEVFLAKSIALFQGNQNIEAWSKGVELLHALLKEEAHDFSRQRKIFNALCSGIQHTNRAFAEQYAKDYLCKYEDLLYLFLRFLGNKSNTSDERKNATFMLAQIDSLPSINSPGKLSDERLQKEDQSQVLREIKVFISKDKAYKRKYFERRKETTKLYEEAILNQIAQKQNTDYLLKVMHIRILPLMPRPVLLFDFLLSQMNSIPRAILSLNSIFFLMQSCNLDFPEFYSKLYALLSLELLNVQQNLPRFFRLLDHCFKSIALPAHLVASFIKRLSRISTFANPQAQIIILPFVYNLFKRHPSTMSLIHSNIGYTQNYTDSYDPLEKDPLLTNAINSSVWELASLQRHYHPTVSSLAKILSQKFTKPEYDLEDFLDHSYLELIESDLKRPLKREPALEFEKRDLFKRQKGELLANWQFS